MENEKSRIIIENGTMRIAKQAPGGRYAYVIYVSGHKKVDNEVRNAINKTLGRQDFELIYILLICEHNHKRTKFDLFYDANIKEVKKIDNKTPFKETQAYENWLLIKSYFIDLYKKHFNRTVEE